jgi:N-acetylglucosamine-6-phosphate deacetylase
MSFDLQVNGYGGVDFNSDSITAEDLHLACTQLQNDGVTGILLTLITDDLTALEDRLRRLVKLRESDSLAMAMIAGFHIEGPFINETIGYRGAHPQQFVVPASVEAASRLFDAGNGLVRLVTLAPERDTDFATTRFLSRNNVRVSAGHCDASLDQLKGAIDAGLSIFTHLGNGCPLTMHRHDNIIQRALSLKDDLWLCFIVDGVHVPFFVLNNYLRATGLERCIAVTDAITPASLGPGRYTLGSIVLDIGEDMVAYAPDSAGGSYFAGSAITMPQIKSHLKNHLGLNESQIKVLTLDNPRRALGDIISDE